MSLEPEPNLRNKVSAKYYDTLIGSKWTATQIAQNQFRIKLCSKSDLAEFGSSYLYVSPRFTYLVFSFDSQLMLLDYWGCVIEMVVYT